MIRRPPRSTPLYSSAASDVYKRQGLGLANGPLERGHVQLAQRPLGHVYVEVLTIRLGVVANVVLRTTAHAPRLQAADVGTGDPSGQERVLRELLEVAPADRGALQVDRWAEHHVDALATRLAGKQLADLTDELLVPAGRQGRGGRQAGRGFVMPDRAALHARWTVRNDHLAQSD